MNSESYLCDGTLGGASIGIRYPFYNATESTLLRVELETGEQYVHVLSPGDETWQLPEGSSGLRKDPWTNFRRAVMAGVDHFLQSWIHFAFVLAICLFADRGKALQPYKIS